MKVAAPTRSAADARGRPASSVCRLEQLEGDGDDHRARPEGEHARGEPGRRSAEAAERRPAEERSPGRRGVETRLRAR